jgi:glycosyltransferase involved in cell wall biosynthesis
MRLCIEVTTCTRARTGIGYYTEHLVDALLQTRSAGDDVVLVSNRVPAPDLATRWSPYLRVRGPGVRALWMQAEVPRMLGEVGADVGVFPNYTVALASPCPTIVVVHDLAIVRMPQYFTLRKRALLEPMLRQSVAAASIVATVSEAARDDIVSLLGVPRTRTALLPCAAHPFCRPAGADAIAAVRARHGLPRPYILTVGTLEPRKNLLTLLRAFDRLGPDAGGHDLVVVGGRGWQDRELVRALEHRAGSRRVRWLGYVDEPDLVALYSGADLFVLASELEGFGLPVLEAMACGAPVIASDVAALREVGGDAARFVPPMDVAAFARAIEAALADRAWAAASRAAGLARANRFSWTRTAEALWASARAVGPSRIRTSRVGGGAATDRPAPLPVPLGPPPKAFTAREWALLATVVYADLFESPLPWQRALDGSVGFSFDEAELLALVRRPALAPYLNVHASHAGYAGAYLVLAGREALVEVMPERERITRALLERNRLSLSVLAVLPFVRSLVVSGGVAHRNPGKRPDVDLFVVAAGGRAYTAYTMLFVATKLTGKRHIVCPNYLVDERELSVVYHRDLFTAHQLLSSRPFSGPRTYEALCAANEAWVKRFFPAFAPRAALGSPPVSAIQRPLEAAISPVAGVLEKALRAAWRLRLRRRAAQAPGSDVVLADGILKLHLSDYRRVVMGRFAERLQTLRQTIDSDVPAASSEMASELDPVGM